MLHEVARATQRMECRHSARVRDLMRARARVNRSGVSKEIQDGPRRMEIVKLIGTKNRTSEREQEEEQQKDVFKTRSWVKQMLAQKVKILFQ